MIVAISGFAETSIRTESISREMKVPKEEKQKEQ